MIITENIVVTTPIGIVRRAALEFSLAERTIEYIPVTRLSTARLIYTTTAYQGFNSNKIPEINIYKNNICRKTLLPILITILNVQLPMFGLNLMCISIRIKI